jgi:hypothetical protein
VQRVTPVDGRHTRPCSHMAPLPSPCQCHCPISTRSYVSQQSRCSGFPPFVTGSDKSARNHVAGQVGSPQIPSQFCHLLHFILPKFAYTFQKQAPMHFMPCDAMQHLCRWYFVSS